MVQWLRLCTSTVGNTGSIPGRGTKIPHGVWPKNKKNPKKHPTINCVSLGIIYSAGPRALLFKSFQFSTDFQTSASDPGTMWVHLYEDVFQ